MKKIAIDIVLLLPQKINEMCLELTKQAVETGETSILLDNKEYTAHISLLMGVIEENQKDQVIEIVSRIAAHTAPLELEITDAPTSDYKAFGVKNTEDLNKLHAELITELQPFLSLDIEDEYFYPADREKISPSLKFHIQNFISLHSQEKFNPHITLHTAHIEPYTLPIKFRSSTIAFNHVGVHGTCREIFYSQEFGN